MTTAPEPDSSILRAEHISKNYGAVTALTDVSLRLAKGEVLGLIGDNGAGKSTLLKILCGFQPPSSGAILLEGREKLRWPLLDSRAMRKEAQEHLDEIGVQVPNINAPVAQLSGGQRQAIAVARSVFSNPKILLLDEPLAAMGVKEGSIILDLISALKAQGNVSIIIIAHNYGQVLEVCDRVNLIQGGKITLDKRNDETSADELTELVVAEYRKALEERRRGA
jgi:simple sugar transport system ATP-binding protein